MADFLKNLPSYNVTNFKNFAPETGSTSRNCELTKMMLTFARICQDFSDNLEVKAPSVYIPTKDYPCEQVITTEKTSILLRYLHQQWEKQSTSKRDASEASLEDGASSSKIPRVANSAQHILDFASGSL